MLHVGMGATPVEERSTKIQSPTEESRCRIRPRQPYVRRCANLLCIHGRRSVAGLALGEPDLIQRRCAHSDPTSRDVLVETRVLSGTAGRCLATQCHILGGGLTAFSYLVIRPQLLPQRLVASARVPLSTAMILLGYEAMVVRAHTGAQLIG